MAKWARKAYSHPLLIEKIKYTSFNPLLFENWLQTIITALFSFYEKILVYIDGGKYHATIICDFNNAFNCGNHNMLLLKLKKIGTRGMFSSLKSTNRE